MDVNGETPEPSQGPVLQGGDTMLVVRFDESQDGRESASIFVFVSGLIDKYFRILS